MITSLALIGITLVSIAAIYANYRQSESLKRIILAQTQLSHDERTDLFNRIQTSDPGLATALSSKPKPIDPEKQPIFTEINGLEVGLDPVERKF